MKKLLVLTTIVILLTGCGSSAGRWNQKGNDAFDKQDYATALEAYKTAQVEGPDRPQPYYNAANTYYRQADYQQAQLQAQAAQRSAGGALAQHTIYNMGNAYFNSQQFEQAIEAYKEALRLNPADQDAKHNLELALQQMQNQQAQQQPQNQSQDNQSDQQNQQQNSQPNQQNQPNKNGENPSTPAAATPTPDSGGEPQPQATPSAQPTPNSSGGQSQPNQQDQSGQGQQPQGQPQPLTEEQARQILEAIADETETLQEHLQRIFVSPGGPPEYDW